MIDGKEGIVNEVKFAVHDDEETEMAEEGGLDGNEDEGIVDEVRFADHDEEEKEADDEEADVATNLESQGPHLKGKSVRRLTARSTRFDVQDKGYLSASEQQIRNAADDSGNVPPELVMDLFQKTKSMEASMGVMKRWLIAVAVVAVAAVAVTIGTNVQSTKKTNKAVEAGNTELKNVVEDGNVLSIGSDEDGNKLLQAKEGGSAVGMKSYGDSFSTVPMMDPNTNRRLNCISIQSVARMQNDMLHAVPSSLAIVNDKGEETEIIPVTGKFKDDGSTLNFGDDIKIIMDSDACDVAFALGSKVESGEANGGEDLTSEEAQDVNETDSDMFNRMLESSGPNQLTHQQVLKHHRELFTLARDAIHNDRRLQDEGYAELDQELPQECTLYDVRWGGSTALDSPDFDRTAWLARFKPCGWYKTNCGDTYRDVDTIEANVDYVGGHHWTSDLELVGQRVYVVEFDVGLHSHVFQRYQDQGDPSLLNVDASNTINLDDETTYRTDSPVLGETCLEIPGKAMDDWGKDFSDWDINYNSMGKCGPGDTPTPAGLAKDCMKHDVCSAFKTIATQQAAEGFCNDIDCGDEALHTVAGCFKKKKWWLPSFALRRVCDESDFINEPDLFFGDLSFAADSDMGPFAGLDRDSCKLFDSWESGQGMPSTLRQNDMPCHDWRDCLSGRCELQLNLSQRCKPRKELDEGCSENWDCISGRCDGVIGFKHCLTRVESAEKCNENTDCLTDKCCTRSEMGCRWCNRRCAWDEESVTDVCSDLS